MKFLQNISTRNSHPWWWHSQNRSKKNSFTTLPCLSLLIRGRRTTSTSNTLRRLTSPSSPRFATITAKQECNHTSTNQSLHSCSTGLALVLKVKNLWLNHWNQAGARLTSWNMLKMSKLELKNTLHALSVIWGRARVPSVINCLSSYKNDVNKLNLF